MGYYEKFKFWEKRVKDRKLFRELLDMSEQERESAFYKDLEFGTAGIRGIMGVGTNRLNIYTIRKITQGVALYMQSHSLDKVVISYDSRNNSYAFACETACVFAASGVSVFITSELMPSPFLSYATRRSGAGIGVMITASHNPREYNGYKVYDSTGCQITTAAASEIADYISKVDSFRLRLHSYDYYVKRGLINTLAQEFEDAYLEEIASICNMRADGLKVVYTPLNGTGYRIVPKVLRRIGCEVLPVPGQDEPNGKFLTCPVPNPEKREALRHGIKVLRNEDADLLIANDPDADRIGVAYVANDETVVLSGNEIGTLMCEYLLSHNKSKKKPVIVRTLVSSALTDKIAEDYGAKVITVPTGFKYIGNVINDLEDSKEYEFLLGYEESQGYLTGTHVRDKDAVIASKLIAIIAAELKAQGKTLGDKLEEIYIKYGRYEGKQISYAFEGGEGENKMNSLLGMLREGNIDTIAGRKVMNFVDYMSGQVDFPPVNMLQYDFDGGSLIIRPSGTEPLIKLYAYANLGDENKKIFRQTQKQFDAMFV